MNKAYFVTGTDTGIGKTLVSSALIYGYSRRGLKAVGMKPVAAGCMEQEGGLLSEDVAMLKAAGNVTASLATHNPYAFKPAIAPHIAAAQSGVSIEPEVIQQAFSQLSRLADVVVVEGVGGFRVPLSDEMDTADLAQALHIPVILVVGMRLGCLNHALITIEAIQDRGLELAGWVANQIDPQMAAMEENLQALEQLIKAPCLGKIPHMSTVDFKAAAEFLRLEI